MSMISLRRAYDPALPDQGRRVLVDRLWPRGISRQVLGAEWLRDIAPSDDLRRWFGHDPAKWPEFRDRYAAELQANPGPVRQLRQMIAQGPVVLLYAAHDPDRNNAVALRDWLVARP